MRQYTLIHFKRQAFSMLELIFVIVILGIVASIGSSMVAQVYESYIVQRAVHTASIKTELAINQLANRLANRIDMSMLARLPSTTGYSSPANVYPIRNVPLSNINQYRALEWIGYDNDSFSATNPPVWSGFVDLNDSSFTNLITPGSQLTMLKTIHDNLAGGTADNPALIFIGANDYKQGTPYGTLCMYSNNGCISPLDWPTVDQLLPFTAGVGNRTNGDMFYTEMYQLVSSAYAIIPEVAPDINGVNVWNLKFYYNYQPWLGEIYTDGNNAMLLENVSVFRFKQEQNSIRIKLCVLEKIGSTSQISICKEKAVIR